MVSPMQGVKRRSMGFRIGGVSLQSGLEEGEPQIGYREAISDQRPAHVRPLRGRPVKLNHPIRTPRLRRCAPYLGLTIFNLFEVVPINQS